MKIQTAGISVLSLALLTPIAAWADEPTLTFLPADDLRLSVAQRLTQPAPRSLDGIIQLPPANAVPLPVPGVPFPKPNDGIVIGPQTKGMPLEIWPSPGGATIQPRYFVVPPTKTAPAPTPRIPYFLVPPAKTVPTPLPGTSYFLVPPSVTPPALRAPFYTAPAENTKYGLHLRP